MTEEQTPAPPPVPPETQVIYWLTEGHRAGDIVAKIQSTWPHLDADQTILAAAEHFSRVAEQPARPLLGWALSAFQSLYRRALEVGDIPAALRAVSEFQKLVIAMEERGLNVPDEDGEQT